MHLFVVPVLAFSFMLDTFNFTGKTEYIIQSEYSLHTGVDLDYKFKLFEPTSEQYMWYVGGAIASDYDCFGKVIKMNTYTTFGIEF